MLMDGWVRLAGRLQLVHEDAEKVLGGMLAAHASGMLSMDWAIVPGDESGAGRAHVLVRHGRGRDGTPLVADAHRHVTDAHLL